MATGVQTILSNQNASSNVTTEWYKTEQRGAWSLDVIILSQLDKDIDITMEVSNDIGSDTKYHCFKIIKEPVHKLLGVSFIYDKLPFDYCRWVIGGNASSGNYKVLFNERN